MQDTITLIVTVGGFLFAMYSAYILYKNPTPFFPTSRKKIRKMIAFAELKPTDIVMDLGSGDGRIVLMCADSVQQAIGIEINRGLCYWGKMMAVLTNKKNAVFIVQDFWETDISHVDVLMLFCIKSEMAGLKEKIQKK